MKQTGLGDNAYIAGYNLSNDLLSLSRIGGGNTPIDRTGIDKSAFERLGGRRDGEISFVGAFNPAEDRLHERMSALPRTDQIVTYCRGNALGAPAACLVSKQINYDASRDAAGVLDMTVQALANGYGLEWGRLATAGVRTDTSATAGASIDTGADGTFGLQAYLHVFTLTGDDVTVTVQSSPDDTTWTDVAVFDAVTTGPAASRIAVSGSVGRYLRVTTSTDAGFDEAQFAAVVVPNRTEVTF